MIARAILSALFIVAGAAHLLRPDLYRPIMPVVLPAHDLLIAISGIAEIAGGAGLLMPPARRLAGVLLILLLVAVFPANVQMLRIALGRGDAWWSEALLWLRLPFQGVLVWWVWRVSVAVDRGDPLASATSRTAT